jgi:hypothetical protein
MRYRVRQSGCDGKVKAESKELAVNPLKNNQASPAPMKAPGNARRMDSAKMDATMGPGVKTTHAPSLPGGTLNHEGPKSPSRRSRVDRFGGRVVSFKLGRFTLGISPFERDGRDPPER